MKRSSRRPRFPGLHLSARDRQFLADQRREGRAVSARTWKRIRMLELLHEQWSLAEVAEAIGTLRVTTEETKRRGIVADVGRETIRQVLAHHELKPWRKKNVVRPDAGR